MDNTNKSAMLQAFFWRKPDPEKQAAYEAKVARFNAALISGNYISIPGWAIGIDGDAKIWQNDKGAWETLDSRISDRIADLSQTIMDHLRRDANEQI